MLLAAILLSFGSCQKDTISPPNQSNAFVKYYGHVASQTGSDLLRTNDGGYILLGSTNSYTGNDERDVFVVRTDSLGNEVWSSSFGRSSTDGNGISGFTNNYLRFDEEGIRLAEFPDGSAYAIACNRTYIKYPDASSNVATRGETKIVMYKIDATTGAPTDQNGFELRSSTAALYTERVSDMKIDSSSGIIKYVLTGMTTEVSDKSPLPNNDNSVSDISDIFTILLNENYATEWTQGNRAYGFIGEDYGVSIQILPQGYLVCGSIQNNYDDTQASFQPQHDLLSVLLKKGEGQPIDPDYYGELGVDFKGGHSVYDPVNKEITILGHVIGGGNAGQLALIKVDEAGIPKTSLQYLDFTPVASLERPYISASIAQRSDKEGYIISATHRETSFEYDICLVEVDNDFNITEGWPYFFGYNDVGQNNVFATQEEAGTVMPVTEAITGTSQTTMTGYAFTGTFGLGTNSMMGLVKINTDGTFTP